MNKKLSTETLKMANGMRYLRVIDQQSGLCLETRINPSQPLVKQKKIMEKALYKLLHNDLKNAIAA